MNIVKFVISNDKENIKEFFDDKLKNLMEEKMSILRKDIFSNKKLEEKIDKETKKIIQLIVKKWESSDNPSLKNLDKIIDLVSKTKKFDKRDIKNKIIDGEVN